MHLVTPTIFWHIKDVLDQPRTLPVETLEWFPLDFAQGYDFFGEDKTETEAKAGIVSVVEKDPASDVHCAARLVTVGADGAVHFWCVSPWRGNREVHVALREVKDKEEKKTTKVRGVAASMPEDKEEKKTTKVKGVAASMPEDAEVPQTPPLRAAMFAGRLVPDKWFSADVATCARFSRNGFFLATCGPGYVTIWRVPEDWRNRHDVEEAETRKSFESEPKMKWEIHRRIDLPSIRHLEPERPLELSWSPCSTKLVIVALRRIYVWKIPPRSSARRSMVCTLFTTPQYPGGSGGDDAHQVNLGIVYVVNPFGSLGSIYGASNQAPRATNAAAANAANAAATFTRSSSQTTRVKAAAKKAHRETKSAAAEEEDKKEGEEERFEVSGDDSRRPTTPLRPRPKSKDGLDIGDAQKVEKSMFQPFSVSVEEWSAHEEQVHGVVWLSSLQLVMQCTSRVLLVTLTHLARAPIAATIASSLIPTIRLKLPLGTICAQKRLCLLADKENDDTRGGFLCGADETTARRFCLSFLKKPFTHESKDVEKRGHVVGPPITLSALPIAKGKVVRASKDLIRKGLMPKGESLFLQKHNVSKEAGLAREDASRPIPQHLPVGGHRLFPASSCNLVRKPSCTTDGSLFAISSSQLRIGTPSRGAYRPAVHIFECGTLGASSLHSIVRLKCSIPLPEMAGMVAFSPIPYHLRAPSESLKRKRRWVLAVATRFCVFFYDTEHSTAIGMAKNIHSEPITDIQWRADGRVLAISSADGFCSFFAFEKGEIGRPLCKIEKKSGFNVATTSKPLSVTKEAVSATVLPFIKRDAKETKKTQGLLEPSASTFPVDEARTTTLGTKSPGETAAGASAVSTTRIRSVVGAKTRERSKEDKKIESIPVLRHSSDEERQGDTFFPAVRSKRARDNNHHEGDVRIFKKMFK